MEEKCSARMRFEAGATIRKSVVSTLKDGAFDHGVKLDIDEDKGWFESVFRIKITGSKENVEGYTKAVKRYFDRIGD